MKPYHISVDFRFHALLRVGVATNPTPTPRGRECRSEGVQEGVQKAYSTKYRGRTGGRECVQEGGSAYRGESGSTGLHTVTSRNRQGLVC